MRRAIWVDIVLGAGCHGCVHRRVRVGAGGVWMTLSLRQWSDHVWAFYRDDGNAFGPRLEYVADSRETVALQAILGNGEHPFGYDVDRPDTTLPTPAGPDRNNLTQQGERL